MTAETAKILEETKKHLDEHQKNSDKLMDLIQEANLRKREQEQMHEQMKMLVENDDDKEAEDVTYLLSVGNVGRNYAGNQKGKGQITKVSAGQRDRSQGPITESKACSGKRRNRGYA